MVSDELLSRKSLDDEEWAITPRPDHLVPDAIERERTRESFRASLSTGPDAVVLTHTDADGYSSAAMLAAVYDDVAVQPLDYHGAYSLEQALGDVADIPHEAAVYVVDLNPDSVHVEAPLLTLTNLGHSVSWYDHHQWDDDVRTAVENTGVDLVIDEDECTASLLARELGLRTDDTLKELAAVTKDRDLWIRDDPRSDDLATFATLADVDEYIATVLEHGPDLPDEVQDRIDERQERDIGLETRAIWGASWHCVGPSTPTLDPDVPYTVAVTYTRGGRSSEIGNHLTEDDDADIAIVMKPHGGVGIYAHSNRETFARCHEVAAELGGGGHPTAAGCEVPVETFRELAEYWQTAGESQRGALLDALRAVLAEEVEADV